MNQKVLNRSFLLKKEDFKIEKVVLSSIEVEPEVKEGNKVVKEAVVEEQVVYVRQMTGREKDAFESSILKTSIDPVSKKQKVTRDLSSFRAKLAVCTVCDETGVCILKPEDAETLSVNMTGVTLDKIVEVASRLNKISEEDVEDLTKN